VLLAIAYPGPLAAPHHAEERGQQAAEHHAAAEEQAQVGSVPDVARHKHAQSVGRQERQIHLAQQRLRGVRWAAAAVDVDVGRPSQGLGTADATAQPPRRLMSGCRLHAASLLEGVVCPGQRRVSPSNGACSLAAAEQLGGSTAAVAAAARSGQTTFCPLPSCGAQLLHAPIRLAR
jgi:hypothetical protein